MHFKRLVAFCFFILILQFIILPSSAYAYLDPGSGSLLLQMFIAFIAGSIFMIKLYWGRIRNFFTNTSSKDIDEDA